MPDRTKLNDVAYITKVDEVTIFSEERIEEMRKKQNNDDLNQTVVAR